MMGPNNLGDINDMLTLCDQADMLSGLPQDITGNLVMDWNKSVAVTGFKEDNATALILKELEKMEIENRELSFFEFEMTYKDVEEKLPPIRGENHRDFVLHLAPHNVKNTVTLVQTAFTTDYSNPDKNGCLPKIDEEWESSKIETVTNCEKAKNKLTEKLGLDGKKFGGLKIETVEDSGRSIDGYLYQLSLRQDNWCTLLVEIPPLEGECIKESVAELLRELLLFVTNIFNM